MDATRGTRILAWSSWVVAMSLAVASIVLLVISIDAPTPEGHFGFRGFAASFALSFGTVGALVASRHPTNPIGWIFVSMGLASGVQELADQYAIYAYLGGGGDLPLRALAAWIPSWIWVPATSGAMLLLLLFPNGSVPSPRWRWVVMLGAVGVVAATASLGFGSGPLANFRSVENPFGLIPADVATALGNGGIATYGAGLILGALALVIRFRRSRGEERQQLKWLVASGLFLSVTLIASFASVTGAQVGSQVSLPVAIVVILGFSSLPVATGIAILRHRLFDIDVVINKTVVYALLAVFITVVYVGIVVGVGALVGSGGNAVLSAAAAAIVAIAFQPVRRRAQRVANRLVYGERATPYEVLSELSERFAGTFSIDDAVPRMVRSLAEATGAQRAEVLIAVGNELRSEAGWPADADRSPILLLGGDAFPSVPGADLTVPVRHGGEILGALAVTKRAGETLTATEERLVQDLAGQAGLALRNVALLEELRASRRRIVQAQDDRARALERNIHDGAQQQLVALAVKARLAQQLAAHDPPRAESLLAEIHQELTQALDDLRDLARGIYPPLLVDRGLGPALEAQARKSPVPVSVDVDGIGRYAPDVEASVYFCALEALNNIAKYAEARHVVVRLAEGDGELRFEVVDDGVGFDPARASGGTGLQGMRDRLAAIGGAVDIRSAPGEGTAVVGRIPSEETG